jgi:hypothetical protein
MRPADFCPQPSPGSDRDNGEHAVCPTITGLASQQGGRGGVEIANGVTGFVGHDVEGQVGCIDTRETRAVSGKLVRPH